MADSNGDSCDLSQTDEFKSLSYPNSQKNLYAFEESYTLDNYVHFINRKKLKQEKVEKKFRQKEEYLSSGNQQSKHSPEKNYYQPCFEIEPKRRRKSSTQVSIFSWLLKDKKAQSSLLLSLDKELILKIYSYLRLLDVVKISSVSSYLFSCYKSLWLYRNFFECFQTEKFSSEELNKVISKSKLDHIQQLKQIYKGKNIKKNRQKIKMKIGSGTSGSNSILEMFAISPKIKNGAVFLMDSHFSQILNSSFKSLKVIELNRCAYLKDIPVISKCLQLERLTITFNEHVTVENLKPIFKRCLKLSKLQLSECRNVEDSVFFELKKISELKSLTLRSFRQSFGQLHQLSYCQKLTELTLDDSMINDEEIRNGIREINHLEVLSVNGCILLTDVFLCFLSEFIKKQQCRLRQVSLQRIKNLESSNIRQIQALLMQKHKENGGCQKNPIKQDF